MSQSRTGKYYIRPLPKNWTPQDLACLEDMILNQKIYDWQLIAQNLNKREENVYKVWKNIVYCKIKGRQKIAGTEKWSKEEDQILINIAKNKLQSFDDVAEFLVDRSIHSISARWKRLFNIYTAETSLSNPDSKDKLQEQFNDFEEMGTYELRKKMLLEIGKMNLRQQYTIFEENS